MPKIEITRTELVWPGKYDEQGNLVQVERVNLPFQVIETVNETHATREAKTPQLSFFDYWEPQEGDTFEEGWKNKLIWGDNKYVMSSLLAQGFAGRIDLIYIDPPFATGADFSFRTQIGDEEVVKEQSIIEEKAYRDTWGRGVSSYLQMMYERLILMRDLLSDTGSIYIHLAHHVGQYMKVILDEIFGADCFQNEIIWFYKTGGATKQRFARKHDNIFFYSKSPDDWAFVPQKERSYMMHKYGFKKSNFQIDEETGLQYSMVYARDVWEIPSVGSATFERVGFDTQKPEALLERIIRASSNEGDLVADFFCGSGTTLAVAEKLGRRWIGCDLGRFAIHTTRKRLLDIEGCKPFEILNLGKYERQVWQGVTFGGQKRPQQMLIFEYLKFILKLYGAEPLAGMEHLHGKKGNAVVHVGAVDAPVTIDEVLNCLDECQATKQKELHVLGWEWEMGLNGLMTEEAKARGIKLLMLHIPREVMEPQAVEKGDIRFFELAYLEAEIKPSRRKRSFTVTLTDFVIPNTELIPEEVRQKVRKWSDYVDYWAVDWNFQNDTFINQWTSYRTRRDRSLQLKTDPHIYDEPGAYNILVKVIDIFGIDTSQLFTVEVR